MVLNSNFVHLTTVGVALLCWLVVSLTFLFG
jgi:hypothetical protein